MYVIVKSISVSLPDAQSAPCQELGDVVAAVVLYIAIVDDPFLIVQNEDMIDVAAPAQYPTPVAV